MRRSVAVLALVLAGCPTGGGGSTPLTLEQFAAGVSATICQAVIQCQASGTAAGYLVQLCVQGGSGIGFSADDLKKAIAAGRVKFDASQGQACLDALSAAAASCTNLDGAPTACKAAAQGTVKAGAVCNIAAPECESGTTCQVTQTSSSSSVCTGTCVIQVTEGKDCTQAPCMDGLTCNHSGNSATCAKRGAAGATCQYDYQCLNGLACDSQKCTAPGTAGTACDTGSNLGCAKGFYCLVQQAGGSTAGVCTAQVAVGGACASDGKHAQAAAAIKECAFGLVCKGASADKSNGHITPGVCAAPSDEGGSCVNIAANTYTITGCKVGLNCQSGKCAKPPTSGACSDDLYSKCLSGSAYCDQSSTTCKAQQAKGASCNSGEECQSQTCGGSGGAMTCMDAQTCHET